jgi:folate-binding protein YgfZ
MTSAGETFVVERVPRAVFLLTGDRPLGYLHDVLAQDVAGLKPGEGAISAVLTANGRVAAEVRVLPLADAVLVDAQKDALPGIMEHIARHAPLAGVECSDVANRFTLAALRGSETDDVLAAAGLPVPGSEEASFARDSELLVVRVAWGGPGADLLGPPAVVASTVSKLDARRATTEELDAARIAAGRPVYGADFGEELLVNETPLLAHGVSMSKGCYPGQESVARIHNLGRIRRELRSLRSAAPLRPGAEVFGDDGKAVGRVTSGAILTDGAAVAIALLAAEVEPGSTVRIDGNDVVVGGLS